MGLIISVMSACSKTSTVKVLGSTSGNINNGGSVAQQGGWIYIADHMYDYHFIKMKMDGSQVIDLGEHYAFEMNLIGDWIYYAGLSGGQINKIKTDGSEMTQLGDVNSSFITPFIVQDDQIYYSNYDDKLRLYTMKTDGTNNTKLSDTPVEIFRVEGDWIYFSAIIMTDPESERKIELRKIRINGKDEKILDNAWVNGELVIDKGWIYYRAEPDFGLYRIRTDGTKKTKVFDLMIENLNIANDRLYFSNLKDNSIQSSNLDGSSVVTLTKDQASRLFIFGDWLYFSNYSQYYRLYRMALDGSQLQEINYVKMIEPDPLGTPIVLGTGRPNGTSQYVGSEGWLYFVSPSGKYQLTKMKTDGSERTDIAPRTGKYLNLIGDWLYFIDGNKGNSIVRMKTDGTQYGIVVNRWCDELIVKDNWMYFSDSGDNSHLYRAKTDGTELTEIDSVTVRMLNLVGEKLFFTTLTKDSYYSEFAGLFSVKTDGSVHTQIADTPILSMLVEGNRIYYTTSSDNISLNLRSMSVTGTDDFSLVPSDATLLGVVNGWVYYNQTTSTSDFKRTKIDGSKTEILMSSVTITQFNSVGEKLVVFNGDDGLSYIMNLDGSDRHDFVP